METSSVRPGIRVSEEAAMGCTEKQRRVRTERWCERNVESADHERGIRIL